MKTIAALAVSLAAFAAPCAAQDSYPAKPIRLIVGYSAGGGNDITARLIAPKMSEALGQTVIVENKPGAQSIIAADYVAKSAPDGYTILMGPSGPMTINPATYSKLPYSAEKDFEPIGMICSFPLVAVVNPKLPIKSIKELIEYAKANPGKANYASSAGIFQISTELFKQQSGAPLVLIPYKGSGDSVKAVITGEVMMTLVDPAPVTGALKAGTVRGLAVTSAKRHPSWPDLPTFGELGMPELVAPVWMALFAPAGTSPAIVAKVHKAMVSAVKDPETIARFSTMALQPEAGTAEQLRQQMAKDVARWKVVAKTAGIKNN